MAEFEDKPEITEDVGSQPPDFLSLISSSDTDLLVRNNGEQVNIDSLKGKKLGLYFSAAWCGPCQRFTPRLIEFYNEISKMHAFEIIFVSADQNEESFKDYFAKMPWLAIPYLDSDTRDQLDAVFEVEGIPHFVFIDENGKVLNNEGVELIIEYGVEGYPFSPERVQELNENEERARKEQSLKSVLVSETRDFVISSNGKQVPVSELEGKTIGLFFSIASYRPNDFTKKLVTIYKKLKETQHDFEVISVSLDEEEEAFKADFINMPWLATPFDHKFSAKLGRYFELTTLPTLVILGPDGKTLHLNVVEAIEHHGIHAYPFTPEKFLELEAIEKARLKTQTLESLLVSDDLDYVIGKDGAKVAVSSLVGKNILLYFSAHWCSPCRAFLPKLVDAYNEIKSKDGKIEVIFISSDRDQSSFDEFFSTMPWLALPFDDPRKSLLSRTFKVRGIPMVVSLGPTGQTVTLTARDLIKNYGANAYPFTEERIKDIEAEYREMTKGWPEKVKSDLHEHELLLSRVNEYECDKCDEQIHIWSFRCGNCDFDLHPKCVLEEEKGSKDEIENGGNTKEGWVCDGEVCYKAYK